MAIEHTFRWKNGTRTKRLHVLEAIRMKCHDCALWPLRLGGPLKKGPVAKNAKKVC